MSATEILMVIIGSMIVVVVVICFACALATRLIFGFKWRAIFGLERQAKQQGSLWYVSRAFRFPVAVFWLGSTKEQEREVALAMAAGRVRLKDYNDDVSDEALSLSIKDDADVWPSIELKNAFGKPCDTAQS